MYALGYGLERAFADESGWQGLIFLLSGSRALRFHQIAPPSNGAVPSHFARMPFVGQLPPASNHKAKKAGILRRIAPLQGWWTRMSLLAPNGSASDEADGARKDERAESGRSAKQKIVVQYVELLVSRRPPRPERP